MAALDGEPNATSPLVEQRWAELYVTPRNPAARWTSRLARRVAADLAARGWEIETVMTDNGSEFRSRQFGETVAALGARQRLVHAGRPRTNGCVERVRGTILEECWKPSFARHLIPKRNGLRRDLVRYLDYYNTNRAHTGRWTRDRTPESVIGKAKLWVVTHPALYPQPPPLRPAIHGRRGRRCREIRIGQRAALGRSPRNI